LSSAHRKSNQVLGCQDGRGGTWAWKNYSKGKRILANSSYKLKAGIELKVAIGHHRWHCVYYQKPSTDGSVKPYSALSPAHRKSSQVLGCQDGRGGT